MKVTDTKKQALGLGLSGAHRTGKTTIAQEIAKENGCPFLTSSASSIAKQMGITVGPGMTNNDRRRFQEAIFLAFKTQYDTQARNGLFVTDRTPMDLAAYALADWSAGETDEDHDAWILDYVDRCMDLTSRYFFLVGVVQPGIPYIAAEGKPAPNDVYQEVLNTTVMGLIRDPKVDCMMTVLPRSLTDNVKRASWLCSVYSKGISDYSTKLREMSVAH